MKNFSATWENFFRLYFDHFSKLRQYRTQVKDKLPELPFVEWKKITSSWKQYFRANKEDFPKLIHGVRFLLYQNKDIGSFTTKCLSLNSLYASKERGAPEKLFISLIDQACPFVLHEKFQVTSSFYAALLASFTDLEFEISP